FAGEGTQTAPTSSALAPYFENAPIHVENYSLVYNRVLTNSITNQLSAGVSYFNQVFSDADIAFDPVGLGLNTGVTDPSGRNDITGHLDENLAWTKGAHEFKFGGEFRQAQVDDFYQTGQRGTIYFDGTQGPWATTSSPCASLGNGTAPYTSSNAPSDPNILFLA